MGRVELTGWASTQRIGIDGTVDSEQRVTLDGPLTRVARDLHGDALRCHVDAVDLRAQQQIESAPGQFGEAQRDVAVLGAQKMMATVHDRDLGPE